MKDERLKIKTISHILSADKYYTFGERI